MASDREPRRKREFTGSNYWNYIIFYIKSCMQEEGKTENGDISMLDPQDFAVYVGFTEEEVQKLCRLHGRNFAAMKRWYDGYTVGDRHSVYNPYSVMQAS